MTFTRSTLVATLALATASALAMPIVITTEQAHKPGAPGAAAGPYEMGLDALVKGDSVAAESAFSQALKANPKSSAAMLGMAELSVKAGKMDEAARWMEKAVQAQPTDANAHESLGRLRLWSGKAKEGEASLRRAIDLDPRAVRARMTLADALMGMGRTADALPLYEQALSIQGDNGAARYALGLALLRQGNTARATTELETSAQLEPRNPLPRLALARLHATRRAYPQALASVNEALALQPTLVEALLLKGDVADLSGKPELAIEAFKEAAAAAPKAAGPHLKMAMLWHRTGQDGQAAAAYRQAIERDAQLAIAYNNLADVQSKKPETLAEAAASAAQAVKLAPAVADFHDTLGWIQRAQGKLPAALVSLEKAASLAPANGQIAIHLATAQREAGDKAKARSTLQSALTRIQDATEQQAVRKLLAELGT
ncbi:MAG: tetratricopeptide repeat protein [Rubrivivax sp.]|nr:tetratricopeptide repeat protein [Rubrivivax sp.]